MNNKLNTILIVSVILGVIYLILNSFATRGYGYYGYNGYNRTPYFSSSRDAHFYNDRTIYSSQGGSASRVRGGGFSAGK